MKKKIFFALLIMLLNFGCGFKIVDQSTLSNFYLTDINTSGDNKINYKIKNKLLFLSSNKAGQLIQLNLNSSKNKTIKEKNINNEITKYQLEININVEIYIINSSEYKKFSLSRRGDYAVSKHYSTTLNSEKKLLALLSNELGEEILDELTLRLNDL